MADAKLDIGGLDDLRVQARAGNSKGSARGISSGGTLSEAAQAHLGKYKKRMQEETSAEILLAESAGKSEDAIIAHVKPLLREEMRWDSLIEETAEELIKSLVEDYQCESESGSDEEDDNDKDAGYGESWASKSRTVLAKLDEKDVSMKAAELRDHTLLIQLKKELRSKKSELVKEEQRAESMLGDLGLSSEEIKQKLASVSYDMGGLSGSIARLRGELDGLQADVRKRAAGAGAGAGAGAAGSMRTGLTTIRHTLPLITGPVTPPSFPPRQYGVCESMADVRSDIGGLNDLRVQAREVLKKRVLKEVKKRTLDQLILQEVETLLDQKDERKATLEHDGMNYGGEGETMVTIAFEPGPLGIGFARNRNGYFVVQSVSGQSKSKNVKVGDVIVTINDKMVESGWSRHDVVDMIRAFNSPDTEEPLVVIFDRQFRNKSVIIIKQRMIERKQNKGSSSGSGTDGGGGGGGGDRGGRGRGGISDAAAEEEVGDIDLYDIYTLEADDADAEEEKIEEGGEGSQEGHLLQQHLQQQQLIQQHLQQKQNKNKNKGSKKSGSK
jgi:hypothetical protein